MNRRQFLTRLFGAGAALAVGPTLLAFVPASKPLRLEFTVPCADLAMTEELLARYIRPAALAMADDVDRRCLDFCYAEPLYLEKAA